MKTETHPFDGIGDTSVCQTKLDLREKTLKKGLLALRRKGKIFTNRFEHIFASKTLECLDCNYVETHSEMSDHLPITAMKKNV